MDFEDDTPSAEEAFYAQCFRKKKKQPERDGLLAQAIAF
jgi:hypothetical protein